MKLIVTVLSGILALSSCSTSKQAKVGSDRDKHGCIASAGFTWSEVRKDCIRTFEIGTKLNNATNKNATTSAFVIFSSDSSVAELFLPDTSDKPIMQKAENCWKNKTFELKKVDGKLLLYKKGKLIYQE